MQRDSHGTSAELTTDQRRRLRANGTAVAARTRELLSDGFVVGTELVEGHDGVRATVAVRPPAGTVVSAGFALSEVDEGDADDIARQIAAGAALEAMSAPTRHQPAGG